MIRASAIWVLGAGGETTDKSAGGTGKSDQSAWASPQACP